jgi:phosphate transport system substrate-binding protein
VSRFSQARWQLFRAAAPAVLVTLLAACGGGTSPSSTIPDSIDTALILTDMPVIDGSTSTEPMRRLLYCGLIKMECGWEDYSFSEHITVRPSEMDLDDSGFLSDLPTSGTHGSYETLIAGESDLIIVARGPSGDEVDAARSAGVEFVIAPVALDAFVFIVNDQNPIPGLSLSQIREIFSGQITDWSEVGEIARPIQPYQRNETSGSQQLMLTLVMGDLPMVEAPDMLMHFTMGGPFNSLSYDGDGIGYSVYYYTVYMQPYEDVRMIAIDGAAPTADSILDGSYPLTSEVFTVIRAGDGGSTRALFDWLQTEEGQNAIAATGYVPLP